MKESGINLQAHYIPVHMQPFYQKNYGFSTGDFPVSENFYKNCFSVPMYPALKIEDQKLIIQTIFDYYAYK